MIRVLLLLALLALVLIAGVAVGRAGKKRALATATAPIGTLLTAARHVAAVDAFDDPKSYASSRATLRAELDLYDDAQRAAAAA